MKVHKSKYPAGTCPKSLVIEMEPSDHGIRYYSENTQADVVRTYCRCSADYNGRQVAVPGSSGMLLPVSLKRLDANRIAAYFTEALQVVATSRRVVSKNGRVMTIRTVSRDRFAKSVSNVGVYERASRERADFPVSFTFWKSRPKVPTKLRALNGCST
jgi:hypothetical protein